MSRRPVPSSSVRAASVGRMAWAHALLLAVVLLGALPTYHSFLHAPRQQLTRPRATTTTAIIQRYARVARREDEDQQQQTTSSSPSDDEMITIPFTGLIGKENGALFDKPLDVYDPLKNTDDLPGEDGSDEKIAAIQQRIQERVEALKKSGEWGDEKAVFGKDPLRNQPFFTTVIQQLKVCKPFESWDELALTYILLLLTTMFMTVYLLALRESVDAFIIAWLKTDFDSDFFSSLLSNPDN